MNIVTSAVVRMRLLDCLFLIAGLAILAFYVPLTISANSDLSAGRFVLFMDERITFDGVKRILHPDGLAQFLDSVLNGGDHRYGRSLWNSIAIFSAIPERLFGDSGQIVAARMLQVGLIFTSYCIFAFGILRSWFLRLTLLVVMLTIPFSDYYMTMPKPEPLQILFLTIFSYFFIKRSAAFSSYWIFIGLAFGTKISTLPALLVFILVSIVARSNNDLFPICRKPLINAAMAFFLGLAIAVPILFTPLLLVIGGYFAFDWGSRKFSLGKASRTLIVVGGIFVIFLASRKNIKVWISNTFLNVTHGADQASINGLSWLNYFFEVWLLAPYEIGLLFLIVIFLYLTFYAVQIFKSKPFSFDQNVAAFTIVASGLALNVAIMIGAKRLWGFYLYPGMVMILVGTIILIELGISNSLKTKKESLIIANRIAGYFVAIYILGISALYWAPHVIGGLEGASRRSKTNDYNLQYSSYVKFTNFLDSYKGAEGGRLHVMFNPSLFLPQSNDKFIIEEFWGPYAQWRSDADIIIFGIENTPRGMPTPIDSPNYKNFILERMGYAAHVADKGKVCIAKPCFFREVELPNGGEILVKSKAN